jgi:ribosomal-protein-alanine N-acetyltransferase
MSFLDEPVHSLFHNSFAALASEGSPFVMGNADDCYWSITGFDSASLNEITLYNGDPEVFESAIRRFQDAHLPHNVFLGGAGLVHAAALTAKGYANKGVAPLMAYALDPVEDHHTLREGLEVKRVTSEEDLAICQEILNDGFGAAAEITKSVTRASLGNPASFRYYLLDGGVPVSTAHFIANEKFLGCFEVVTSPMHQRHGYGEELMRWAMAHHAALGHELIVLQASKSGLALYEDLNFQVLQYLQAWQLEDVVRMRRFTHDHLQLGEFSLRPLHVSDAPWCIPFYNDPDIQKWMPVPDEYGPKEFAAQLEKFTALQRNGLGINWVVEREGEPVAMLGCHTTDWKRQATEIGYAVLPPSRGQGIVTALLGELVPFLFTEYGFVRIEVQAAVENTASRRSVEKAGFTHEGTLRQRYLHKGVLTDDAVYAKIREDSAG